ncbi:hypothetical protein M407DRAFT_33117 [Tulasnella calospora MUT 4182]|uniref:Uncharacterized protein n=1 Tax=Tulasnella calospora MUT 4182 TaxID=1051891 RepID=A0A0C3Q2V5_9AGAM|nr:hypothetical protein M407DRAFT_33117 [Tulasnella calospora MUT 4182]
MENTTKRLISAAISTATQIHIQTNFRALSALDAALCSDINIPATSIDLPYDILYIIFVLCWSKIYSRNQLSFPTIASHVCRKWREHALDTPAFWASLDFRDSSPQLKKHQIWLERSKDYPLDIALGGFLFDSLVPRSFQIANTSLTALVRIAMNGRTVLAYAASRSSEIPGHFQT